MKLAPTLFCLFLTFSALAGDQGHGGDGVLMDGKLYLMDFVEAGIEANPQIDENITVAPGLRQQVRNSLIGLSDETSQLVATKLAEVEAVYPPLAYSILTAIKGLSWRIVNPTLVDMKDEDTVLSFPHGRLVQLAIRRHNAVMINSRLWKSLSPRHKAGLVFHEATYLLTGKSPTARLLTGLVFSPELSLRAMDLIPLWWASWSGFNESSYQSMFKDGKIYGGPELSITIYARSESHQIRTAPDLNWNPKQICQQIQKTGNPTDIRLEIRQFHFEIKRSSSYDQEFQDEWKVVTNLQEEIIPDKNWRCTEHFSNILDKAKAFFEGFN